MPTETFKISGTKPGPNVAVFAGVHGNEMAGVFALQEMMPKIKITRGVLYVVFANPPAIKVGVRMINKNLNRCFYSGNNGTAYEDVRARELMAILDNCEALLDLHMFYDDNGLPFIICEDNAFDLANVFDVDIISTNWTKVEPGGTDAYMYQNGKLGICLECGPISKAKEYKKFAKRAIYQFLKYFDMTNEVVEFSIVPKNIIRADKAVIKNSEDFKLTKGFKNFDKLVESQIIATQNGNKFTAMGGDCIIFPHYKARVGEEAYILGKFID